MTPGTDAVSATAVATAVALVTRQALAPDIPRQDVLGGSDPAGVLAAMETVTAGLLAGVWPGDKGANALARIGLAVADLAGPCTSAGGR